METVQVRETVSIAQLGTAHQFGDLLLGIAPAVTWYGGVPA
jgi:hypothetical protein